MKNLKNTVAAVGLMAVLGMGTATANAGILISDRTTPTTASTEQARCTPGQNSFVSQMAGIIVVGIKGIIVVGRSGLLLSDVAAASNTSRCSDDTTVSATGILISD